MTLLSGKAALVIGGTSGIGRATALAFAREGAQVVVSGRRTSEGQAVAEEIRARGGKAVFVPADATQEHDVRALVENAISVHGRLDIAFNNAGNEGTPGPLTERDNADYDKVMDANVRSTFLAMKHELAHMIANGGGTIVNTASTAAHIGFAGAALYTASKHAVLGMTKAAALEVAQAGVRVNAVSPGAVDTDLLDRFTGGSADVKQFLSTLHPIGRIARPEEIAEAVVWLCADASSFVTGQTITVDGGQTAQ